MRPTLLRSMFSILLVTALAQAASAGIRPELDVALQTRPSAATVARQAQAAKSAPVEALVNRSQIDERFEVPSFVWLNRGADAVTPVAAAKASTTRTADQAARAVLGQLAPLYRLQPADVSAAVLRHVHDIGSGGIIVTYTQSVNGIDVFRDEVHVLLDRALQPISVSGSLPSRASIASTVFALTAGRAVSVMLQDFGLLASEPAPAQSLGALEGGYESFAAPAEASQLGPELSVQHPLRAKPVYFRSGESLEPAYYLEVMTEGAAYAYVISASDGRILMRHDQMANDVFSYRAWAGTSGLKQPFDGPQGNTPSPHPAGAPNLFNPALIAPNLVSLQNGPISTNDPWLPPGALQTMGNNVDAYADLVAPDGFSGGDLRATTNSANAFDRVYDTNLAPNASTTQQMAAITQMFFDNNFFHDWYYDAGYNEASGNMQTNNFGRGGLGGDALRAEAQDFSGTNNANMSTPADGAPGRMQMYVFNPVGASVVTVNLPLGIAGSYAGGVAEFGPTSFTRTGDVVLAIDGVAPTSDACSALTNGASIAGKIALIDRGTCTYILKAQAAQAAGAIGVIIVDNAASSTPPGMTGTGSLSIPVLSVTLAVGNLIKGQLAGGVNVTLTRVAQLSRDGGIDNQIVAHEWGHSISNRLIGNGSGLGNQQGGGMGEGWADFHALLMTVQPEDALVAATPNFTGTYSVGSYAVSGNIQPTNAYYFGVRRYPYSSDLTKNPLTFKHIQDGNALPVGPAAQTNTAANSEVHNTGEVWCSMLWECYSALLRDTGRLTFAQARDRMRSYLVAAYKLTPSSPTFTEARDAVLAVALANDAADCNLFWAAFAKRGCGVGAVSPDRGSATNTPVVESFLVGGDAAISSLALVDDVSSCDHDGYLDDGEVGTLTVQVKNTGSVALGSLTGSVSSTNPAISFPSGNALTFAALPVNGTATATVRVKLGSLSGLQLSGLQASVNDPAFVVAGPRVATLNDYLNANDVPSATETVESRTSPWTISSAAGSTGSPFTRIERAAGSHAFFIADGGGLSDHYLVSPPIHVLLANTFFFSFSTSFSFEKDPSGNYDAGVIELSNDNGASWIDIGANANPGYTGTIFSSSGNVLGGRPGFVGVSAGYPALSTQNVVLGTTYQGQTVLLRFRMSTDQGGSGPGWTIDDIALSGTYLPFIGPVGQSGSCSLLAVEGGAPQSLAFAIEGRNPAAGRASFRLALPAAATVDVGVFDILGRRVATVAQGELTAGEHVMHWDPAANGGAARAGVYLARMRAGEKVMTRRFVLLR